MEHTWKLFEDQSPSLRGTNPDGTAWKCAHCGTLRFDVENWLDSAYCPGPKKQQIAEWTGDGSSPAS